jgi:hypothetical protein
MADVHNFTHFSPIGKSLVHLQQTDAILRVLVFLLLAGFSRMLAIGWRNRELQIATGLGFYSLVSISVAAIQAHQPSAAQYSHLDNLDTSSYVATMLYWILCFSRKEPERKPFTPRMERILLTFAGEANRNANALKAKDADDRPK